MFSLLLSEKWILAVGLNGLVWLVEIFLFSLDMAKLPYEMQSIPHLVCSSRF